MTFDLNRKDIVITGGGGYLGSRLGQKLMTSQNRVILLDLTFNELAGQLCEKNSNMMKATVDLTKSDEVKAFFKDTDPCLIFHFAALLDRRRDFSLFSKMCQVNVQGTFNLLDALSDKAYINFIYASSSEVYGSLNTSPFNENMRPDPVSPYSLTKYMAEETIRTYSAIHAKPFTIFRLFNLIGPDMPESFFVNELINKLKRDEVFHMTAGEQIRDFVYIEDALNVIKSLSETAACIAETINICSGKGVAVKDVALTVARLLNKTDKLGVGDIPYRNNEVWEMIGDASKLSTFYDITDFLPFQNAINKTIHD